MLNKVRDFHKRMGMFPFSSVDISKEFVDDKRCDMIDEEGSELKEAIRNKDSINILHEACDDIYIALGAILEAGYSEAEFQAAFAEVHRANMDKTPPEHPVQKATKGLGWMPADVAKAIEVPSSFKAFVSYSFAGPDGVSASQALIDAPGTGFNRETLASICETLAANNNVEKVVLLHFAKLEE